MNILAEFLHEFDTAPRTPQLGQAGSIPEANTKNSYLFCSISEIPTKFLQISCHSYRPTFETPKVLDTLGLFIEYYLIL